MSREYMLDRWCVRCGRKEATPYTRKQMERFFKDWDATSYQLSIYPRVRAIDIGCGNGRNSSLLKTLGAEVLSFDYKDDHGYRVVLGKDALPVYSESVDIILANYVFMFLNKTERKHLMQELNRISRFLTEMVVELYPAKDSYAPDQDATRKMQEEIIRYFSKTWAILHNVKDRFTLKKKVL